MKIAVLGGLGIQGIAALTDLSNSKIVDEVICVDTNLDLWDNISRQVDVKKFSQDEKKRQYQRVTRGRIQ